MVVIMNQVVGPQWTLRASAAYASDPTARHFQGAAPGMAGSAGCAEWGQVLPSYRDY